MYPKDTEKWKQFTTDGINTKIVFLLLCIPKILKNESNSQQFLLIELNLTSCCVSQRYWKMKAIHNTTAALLPIYKVVVYPKDTEKWKQFTTCKWWICRLIMLLCIPKILKNESNSQLIPSFQNRLFCCCVSQRYWKMKAIHNLEETTPPRQLVVVYPKDTEKWKQFTTHKQKKIKKF